MPGRVLAARAREAPAGRRRRALGSHRPPDRAATATTGRWSSECRVCPTRRRRSPSTAGTIADDDRGVGRGSPTGCRQPKPRLSTSLAEPARERRRVERQAERDRGRRATPSAAWRSANCAAIGEQHQGAERDHEQRSAAALQVSRHARRDRERRQHRHVQGEREQTEADRVRRERCQLGVDRPLAPAGTGPVTSAHVHSNAHGRLSSTARAPASDRAQRQPAGDPPRTADEQRRQRTMTMPTPTNSAIATGTNAAVSAEHAAPRTRCARARRRTPRRADAVDEIDRRRRRVGRLEPGARGG